MLGRQIDGMSSNHIREQNNTLWNFDVELHDVTSFATDFVGAQIAGPGIRYYHLAEELSRKFNVVLQSPMNQIWLLKPVICTCLNIVEVTDTLYNFSPTMLRSS